MTTGAGSTYAAQSGEQGGAVEGESLDARRVTDTQRLRVLHERLESSRQFPASHISFSRSTRDEDVPYHDSSSSSDTNQLLQLCRSSCIVAFFQHVCVQRDAHEKLLAPPDSAEHSLKIPPDSTNGSELRFTQVDCASLDR